MTDQNLVSDSIGDVVDLIYGKLNDEELAYKGQEQIQKIAFAVCKQIIVLFDTEGSVLTDIQKDYLLRAVSQAFQTTNLNSDLISQLSLDPAALSRVVIENGRQLTIGFTETESAFYEMTISRACRGIVSIASSLPEFTESAVAEILRRENHLIGIAENILNDLRLIRNTQPQISVDLRLELFEKDYLESVYQQLNSLKLFGLDVSQRSQSYSLSVAYISLDIQKRVKQQETLMQLPSVAVTGLPAETALVGQTRLLIIGDAGSGKTTLLQWLAVNAAKNSFPRDLNYLNGKIPFFIPLRRYVGRDFPKPEEFPDWLAGQLTGTMPQGWVHQLLSSGRAIVLVDGIDEIPDRDALFEWAARLITTFADAVYLFTTRPNAVRDDWFESQGFEIANLLELQSEAIDKLIENWHQAIRGNFRLDKSSPDLELIGKNLRNQIRQNQAVRTLARTPLLCAALCALNLERPDNLPRSRIPLYNALCAMLLHRRDTNRKIDYSRYPQLTEEQKLILLRDLAYNMFLNGETEVQIEYARNRIAKKLRTLAGRPETATPSKVLQLLVDRSGIVRQPVKGRVDFTHKTLLEYLAASEAVEQEHFGLMIENAHKDQWREMIILAAGLANRKKRDYLLRQLVERGNREQEFKQRLHLLAVACLETSLSYNSSIRTLINESLRELVPPRTLTEARSIASAGDLAVPHLAQWKGEDTTTVGACIVALALIGTENALDTLKTYTADTDQSLLVRMWDYFEPEEYARTVLSRYETLTLTSLQWVQYLSNIRDLTITGKSIPTDISVLRKLPKLETVHFSQIDVLEVTSLGGTEFVRQPRTIRFTSKLDLLDFSVLLQLPQEMSVKFQLVEQVILPSLKGVERVDIEFREHVTDLTLRSDTELNSLNDLKLFPNLEELTLIDLPHIESLTPLTSLAKLKILTLHNMTRWVTYHELKSMKGLEEFNLFGAIEFPFDLYHVLLFDTMIRRSNLDLESIKDIYRPYWADAN